MYREPGSTLRWGPAAERYLGESRVLDFHRLPRTTRQRLVASLTGEGGPIPLIARRTRHLWTPRRALALSVAAVLVLLGLLFVGFGQSESPWMQAPGALALVYAALLFVPAAAALGLVHQERRGRRLPFAPGVYLLPFDLIDATTHRLAVFPLAGLSELRVVEEQGMRRMVLHFGRASAFAFEGRPELLAGLERQLASARTLLDEVTAGGDLTPAAALDPLFELRMGDDLAAADEVSARGPDGGAPRTVAPLVAMAAVGALAAGALLLAGRNAVSDDTAYTRARSEGTVPALSAYLSQGRRHAPLVREVWLPRAALLDAQDDGTVEAFSRFLATYPGSRYQHEAERALEGAYARELEMAKRWRSTDELRRFLDRYPASPVDAQARAALARQEADDRGQAPVERGGFR